MSLGLQQRLVALNRFIDDLYNDQQIIADGVFPADLLEASVNYRPQCRGVHPKHGAWAHISGTDLVRDDDGKFYVLEDNLRVPSGVSYVIENRGVAKRAFAELFERQRIRPVDGYTDALNRLLTSLAPDGCRRSAARRAHPGDLQLGVLRALVPRGADGGRTGRGRDLVVGDDEYVYMKTIDGLERVDVIYRRIDDLFLDPEAFNEESVLGVPG